MRTLTTISLLLFGLTTFGQTNRSLHWCFGWRAGLDFTSGQPFADTTRNLESIEGCSSISDTAGNLLFYSNGENVWDSSNDIMQNGNGLLGNQSSEQSSLIVPQPGSYSLYYLFTTGNSPTYTLRYNIIDMNLNMGSGAVTSSKNILLFNSGTEGMGGTMHCNAKDYWIVSRQQHTDTLQFYSYLLDSSGLSNPIINTFYFPSPWWNSYGFIKFAQDGSKMCYSSFGNPICIFDFNTQSGILTFNDSISKYPNEQLYSNEISPDKSRIYITSWAPAPISNCYLSQFDLTAANVTASRVNLDSVDYSNGSPDGYGFIGELQIAPDQKIYLSRWKQTPPPVNPNTFWTLDSIDVIQNPNGLGGACNFQRNILHLNHKPTEHGLPNFISNFTFPTALINTTNNCQIGITDELSSNLNLELFPNPFTDKTFISINYFINEKFRIQINDIFGREVTPPIKITSSNIEIERGNLPTGVYFVKLWNDKILLGTMKLIAL